MAGAGPAIFNTDCNHRPGQALLTASRKTGVVSRQVGDVFITQSSGLTLHHGCLTAGTLVGLISLEGRDQVSLILTRQMGIARNLRHTVLTMTCSTYGCLGLAGLCVTSGACQTRRSKSC